MIRVTFIDGQKYSYVYYNCEIDKLELVTDYGQKEYIPYGNIIKVEKQVKDLTNEEELKLKLLAKTFIYDGTKYRVKYTMNNPRRYPEYYLDDYIDITQLVKMNNYCGKNYTNVYGDEMVNE